MRTSSRAPFQHRSWSEAIMREARALFLVLMVLPAVAAGDGARSNGFKGGTFDPPAAAPDFTLQGSNGEAVGISRYRGKVVALAFGFTQCSRICPVTLANLARASKQLGKSAADLQVLFVTVDPERDSGERLHSYLSGFNPAFLGATGSQAQLEAVRQSYGVMVQRETGETGRATTCIIPRRSISSIVRGSCACSCHLENRRMTSRMTSSSC